MVKSKITKKYNLVADKFFENVTMETGSYF